MISISSDFKGDIFSACREKSDGEKCVRDPGIIREDALVVTSHPPIVVHTQISRRSLDRNEAIFG